MRLIDWAAAALCAGGVASAAVVPTLELVGQSPTPRNTTEIEYRVTNPPGGVSVYDFELIGEYGWIAVRTPPHWEHVVQSPIPGPLHRIFTESAPVVGGTELGGFVIEVATPRFGGVEVDWTTITGNPPAHAVFATTLEQLPIPEPAAMAALVLVGAALSRRRA